MDCDGGAQANYMITVSDKIYIDLDAVKTPETIFDVLVYDNPEYHMKKNLGISVLKVPKKLESGWIKGRTLEVMRGEALRIKGFFTPDQWQPVFRHPDHPIKLQYINNDFPLDEYQERAVQAIKGNRQGIVHAVTSAGKTLIILKSICELGQRALVVVHRKILMEQLLEDIEKYIRDENGEKITPGIIGDGKRTVGPITIGIDRTLAIHLDSYKELFGVVILDECHIAPAQTIFSLINALNSRYRFGFSGTLRRKDQKEFLIFATFGTVIATISRGELLTKGRVVPVEIKIIESGTRFNFDEVSEALGITKARALQEKVISEDPVRRDIVIDQVARLKGRGKTLVLSRYVQPCYDLAAILERRFGIKSGIITGRDAKRGVAEYNEMKHGDLQVIFATIGCVSTGVSISDLENMILISPVYTNELLLHQIRGRLMRTSEGKTHGTLYFVWDQNIFSEEKLDRFLSIMRK